MSEPPKPGTVSASTQIIEGKFAEDLVKVFNVTHVAEHSNPRVIAIVAAAYIENHLTQLIREKLPGLTKPLTQSIFNDKSGPLGTIGNKIDMAQALQVIRADFADQARLIARVRNRFAHELDVDSFEHVRVRDIVDKLKGGSPDELTREQRFKNAVMIVCGHIMHGHIKFFPFNQTEEEIAEGPKGPSPDKSSKPARNPKSNPDPEGR